MQYHQISVKRTFFKTLDMVTTWQGIAFSTYSFFLTAAYVSLVSFGITTNKNLGSIFPISSGRAKIRRKT
jgi:hypothetical protein